MPENTEITNLIGIVERVVFTNPENGYAILRLRADDGNIITVVGKLERRRPGERLNLVGKWKEDIRWGKQFEAEICSPMEPDTDEGLKRYLASDLVKGIGEKFAEKLVEKFGSELLNIIRNNPERLREIPGIGDKRIEMIRNAILSEDRENRIIRELSTRLMDFGFGMERIRKIYKRYGDFALDLLSRDPFRLIDDIYGIGFLTADRIASKFDIANNNPSRIRAGLLYVLGKAGEDGHCYLPKSELIEQAEKLLNVDVEYLTDGIKSLAETGEIVIEGDRIYSYQLFISEETSAIKLIGLLRERAIALEIEVVREWLEKEQKKMRIHFTREQHDSIERILTREPVLALTGGPGTGKTTIISAVAHIAKNAGWNVALCAPTGRAANRLTEASGMDASTIHRLLEYNPQTGFSRSDMRHIDAELVIVDEMSMVDIELFNALLASLERSTRLLLVGDKDQLPSVGPGQVFSDIIESGAVPISRLTQIHRQSEKSGIVRESNNIIRGNMPRLKNEQNSDFFFINEEDRNKGLELVADLVTRRLPEHYGFDPSRDIQVVVPMYRGICGANALNQLLKNKLNPGEAISPFKFKPGDKVMQIKNNYDLWVFNGDIGIVRGTDPDREELEIEFDRIVKFKPRDAEDLVLAYAITVHKSQGSEIPCVVIPLYSEHFLLLKRRLLYTSITRAKRICVIVGQLKALETAVRNSTEDLRFTALSEKLRKISSVQPIQSELF